MISFVARCTDSAGAPDSFWFCVNTAPSPEALRYYATYAGALMKEQDLTPLEMYYVPGDATVAAMLDSMAEGRVPLPADAVPVRIQGGGARARGGDSTPKTAS